MGGSSSWEACFPTIGVIIIHSSHCLEVIPTSPADSYRLFSSFYISNKIIVLFLVLLSTIRSGWIGLVEVMIGFAIGYFVTPSLSHPRPYIRCPAFIVSSLTVHHPIAVLPTECVFCNSATSTIYESTFEDSTTKIQSSG